MVAHCSKPEHHQMAEMIAGNTHVAERPWSNSWSMPTLLEALPSSLCDCPNRVTPVRGCPWLSTAAW